jgi:hypothetical protein
VFELLKTEFRLDTLSDQDGKPFFWTSFLLIIIAILAIFKFCIGQELAFFIFFTVAQSHQ